MVVISSPPRLFRVRQLRFPSFVLFVIGVGILWWWRAITLYNEEALYGNFGALNVSSSTILPPPRLQRYKLIICGAAKNAESHLPQLNNTISSILSSNQSHIKFDLLRIVIFENDSVDATVSILNKWPYPITLLSSKFSPSLGRTSVLAHARNTMWEHILNVNQEHAIDYVLMMDLDEVNYGLRGLSECLDLPPDWTVCCANQATVYYDLWALRATNWLSCDWYNDCPGTERNSVEKNRHIPASNAPIKVESCFGGASLYKWKHLYQVKNLQVYKGARKYWGRSRKKKGTFVDVCEHTTFLGSIRKQSPSTAIYIQPKFLNRGIKAERIPTAVIDHWKPQWESSWKDPSQRKYYSGLENWHFGNSDR